MTLTQLFTNIANAIRAKTGSSETIKAENFPTEIADITTGNLSDEEYTEANTDLDNILEGSTPTKIFPPDWSEIGYEDTPNIAMKIFNYAKEIQDNWDSSITTMRSKYSSDKNLYVFPLVDTSNVISMFQAFLASNLTDLANIDTSSVLDFSYAFRDCKLESFPQIDTSKATGNSFMFLECSNLKNLPVLNFKSINNLGFNNTYSNCTSLTDESLNNILASLITATRYNRTKTLAYIGLTSEQATICTTLSNWQACVDAGWTTGY